MNTNYTIRKLLKFSFPTIIMMIFTSIYGVVDGLFISNVEGDTAFSGVNLIMPYIMIFGTFGYMFGTGGSALVSKTYGEGDVNKGNRYFTIIFETLIGVGVICTIVGYFTIKDAAKLLGANEQMLPYCQDYGKILILFIGFFMIQNAFQSFMVLANKPNLGFVFTLIAGLVNIFGDYLLIYVVKMGVAGAAIATGASQIIGALLPICYLIINRKKLQLNFVKTKYEIKPVLDSSLNGLSEMVTNVSMSLVNMLFNAQLMKYIGQDGVTAFGIIMYVGFIFTGIYFGFSIGVVPIISYQYGAKNKKELQNLFKKCMIIYAGFALVVASCSIGSARFLASAFIKNNEELLALSTKALRLYSIGYYLSGFNIFISSFFTDLNDGFVSGFISLVRTLVFQIIAIYLIPMIFGQDGLWLAIVFAELLSLIVCTIFLITKNKKYGYIKTKNDNKEIASKTN